MLWAYPRGTARQRQRATTRARERLVAPRAGVYCRAGAQTDRRARDRRRVPRRRLAGRRRPRCRARRAQLARAVRHRLAGVGQRAAARHRAGAQRDAARHRRAAVRPAAVRRDGHDGLRGELAAADVRHRSGHRRRDARRRHGRGGGGRGGRADRPGLQPRGRSHPLRQHERRERAAEPVQRRARGQRHRPDARGDDRHHRLGARPERRQPGQPGRPAEPADDALQHRSLRRREPHDAGRRSTAAPRPTAASRRTSEASASSSTPPTTAASTSPATAARSRRCRTSGRRRRASTGSRSSPAGAPRRSSVRSVPGPRRCARSRSCRRTATATASPDFADNCPAAANAGQENLDGDGQGDACDADQDGDGLSDAAEGAIGTNPRSAQLRRRRPGRRRRRLPGGRRGDRQRLSGACASQPPRPNTRITARPKSGTSRTRDDPLHGQPAQRDLRMPARRRRLPDVHVAAPAAQPQARTPPLHVRAISRTTSLIDRTPATATWTVRRKRT